MAAGALFREIFVGTGLGIAVGVATWKTYHWKLSKDIQNYYTKLDQVAAERAAEQKHE
jgi:hypothetical protein